MKSGVVMKRELIELGIPVQKLVRFQDTGDYSAEFFIPEMQQGVLPAAEWAQLICDVMPDARIVGTHDTIAHWREGQPVIYASVVFKIGAEDE